MIEVKVTGSFDKTFKFLNHAKKLNFRDLDRYGKMGVEALRIATPVDSGDTASSWNYEIIYGKESVKLIWTNSNLTKTGVPIAILLQYGHATGSGAYVQGRDYINPALRPVFDKIAEEAWKEVKYS